MTNVIRLIEIIGSFKMTEHFYLEGDPFFSCPMHPEYHGNQQRDYCNCGFQKNNDDVTEALSLIEKLLVTNNK